jgi:hypothetical protein
MEGRAADLDQYVFDRRLRTYQAELARGRPLVFPDPWTGLPVECCGTVLNAAKSFSYRFLGSDGEFWLLTADISSGYSLAGLYLEQERVFIRLSDLLSEQSIERHVDAIERSIRPEPVASRANRMVLGHPNFAHFVWNELAAAIALEGCEVAVGRVTTVHEPILPLNLLVDWLKGEPPEVLSTSELHVNELYCHDAVLFAPGSQLIDISTKKRVVDRCLEHRPPPCDAVPGHGTFNLWISLRLLYRRALNDGEFVLNLIIAQLTKHAQMTVMLDGYSLPDDVATPFRYYADDQRKEAERVRALAARLISQVPEHLAARVYDLTGMTVPTAIAAASLADFYICHHGTQQHKIGWLNATPGLIHANVEVLESGPAGWVQSQSEGSIAPIYVPTEMVRNDNDPQNSRAENPYFGDYTFVDLPALADLADRLIGDALNNWRPKT